MFTKELREAKDCVERAKSLFLNAASEPDGDSAMILIGIGRTYLQVAEEIERKVDAKFRRSGASALLRGLGYAASEPEEAQVAHPDLATVSRRMPT
jgi:hypothetical protein